MCVGAHAHLDDLLHNVAVLVPHVARVHLHVVVALHRRQLDLYVAAGQRHLPGLCLHLDLQMSSAQNWSVSFPGDVAGGGPADIG